MTTSLLDLDFTGARIEAYRLSLARRAIPGMCDWWVTLASGELKHLRFREVRGFNDLGCCGALLEDIVVGQRSGFARALPPTPVYEKSGPGVIFRIEAARGADGKVRSLGEVIAASGSVRETTDPIPDEVSLAAPIAWADAEVLLTHLRLLGVAGGHRAGEAWAAIRAGSPRGEYWIQSTGLVSLEERGFPGEKGIGAFAVEEVPEGMRVGLGPGGHSGERWPLSLTAGKVSLHRVVDQGK